MIRPIVWGNRYRYRAGRIITAYSAQFSVRAALPAVKSD
jgi:hypothetical protein